MLCGNVSIGRVTHAARSPDRRVRIDRFASACPEQHKGCLVNHDDDRPNRRPTVDKVAELAGVGRATVSRVINGASNVSPATKAAVERAIEELGYSPNQAARSLVTRQTNTVALVVSEPEDRIWDEPYFPRVIRGISAALNETGYQMMLTITRTAADQRRLEAYLTGRHVDGVLLISLHGNDPLPARLEEHGVPTVLGGAPVGVTPVACVDADNQGGARAAVEHLLERGRTRVATIAGPQDMRVGVDRLTGYRAALEDAGVRVPKKMITYGDFSAASGLPAMRQLLRAVPDVDAVFAASDPMAIGAMRALREAGKRVPQDVAVVGFDDSLAALHTDPPLTTVHQPVEAMGKAMAQVLVQRIRGEEVPVRLMVLDTDLVVRESS